MQQPFIYRRSPGLYVFASVSYADVCVSTFITPSASISIGILRKTSFSPGGCLFSAATVRMLVASGHVFWNESFLIRPCQQKTDASNFTLCLRTMGKTLKYIRVQATYRQYDTYSTSLLTIPVFPLGSAPFLHYTWLEWNISYQVFIQLCDLHSPGTVKRRGIIITWRGNEALQQRERVCNRGRMCVFVFFCVRRCTVGVEVCCTDEHLYLCFYKEITWPHTLPTSNA